MSSTPQTPSYLFDEGTDCTDSPHRPKSIPSAKGRSVAVIVLHPTMPHKLKLIILLMESTCKIAYIRVKKVNDST